MYNCSRWAVSQTVIAKLDVVYTFIHVTETLFIDHRLYIISNVSPFTLYMCLIGCSRGI